MPFTDVGKDDWFYNAVTYAYNNHLFSGISDTIFAPNGTMTRAMLVTVLYSYDKPPKSTAANPFSDVPDDAWYANAVIWAADNSIVAGIGEGQFAPNNNITREQVAAILYRFAKDYKGFDVSNTSELAFNDNDDIAVYAQNAVKWCVANKIITGMDGNRFEPLGSATRAQVAAMMQRFTAAFR